MSDATKARSRPIFYVLTILIGFGLALLILESLLHLFPVGNAVLLAEIEPSKMVKRYRPGSEIQWSAGWDFVLRTRKKVDGLGFLNDHPVPSSSVEPLMVVIGDSYVEALQVEDRAAHHALLHEAVGNRGHVRGMGTSGSPLANYLVYAELSKRELEPSAYVFVVIGNDFDESMCPYFNGGIGMWCFRERNSDQFDLVPVEAPLSTFRALARRSALLRYLAFNLHFDWRRLVPDWRDAEDGEQYVGNVSAKVNATRLRASERAVDLFLTRLPESTGLPSNRVLLVIDGIRQHIYHPDRTTDKSFFAHMREYFEQRAAKLDYEVVDLHPAFEEDYLRHGERFEFPEDGHWNPLGHWVVANAIAHSKVFTNVFGDVELGKRPGAAAAE